ncbi:type I secretion system permease/ATPase [Sulfurimonas sp. NW15]|uniref:type I secretion system permease/ATPase n=1 Tax=Sulfurimonas sp. NW15 TaxID=2922729 RepID=UPI003DA89CD9
MNKLTKEGIALTKLEQVLKETKKSFLFVGFFSFFVNILMLVPSIYMLQVYDRVMASQSIETLVLLTIIVVFLFATMGVLELIRSRILVRIGNKMDLALNGYLFDVIFNHARLNPAQASSMPVTDLIKIRQYMTGNGVFALFDSPWFPIYLFVMYIFSPWFAAFTVFAALVIMTITIINEKTTKKDLASANKMNNLSIQYLNKNLQNAEVVHAMGMNDNIKNRWLEKHHSFLKIQASASDKAGKWSNMSKTLRQLFQSLTYGIGAYLAINGLISPGVIIAGAVLMGRALQPLDLLTNSWKGFADAKESYKRLNNLLKEVPELPEPMQLPAPKGEIKVENIVVTPPAAKVPALKGISMYIPQGMTVGIVGPSASGKSTFARAILGVWPLAAGKVRLDGADIHQWNSIDLGKYIGYLPQDIELFEGSISENIARFSEVDPESVVEAATTAGVHHMILTLPNGYDTVVGAGGSTLSGGQRQRIGLARALYKKPPLIVLDEPNSNLDEEGEKALLNAIVQMKENGSTIIVITHRPNILAVVDNLAVFTQGTLSMYGPKNEVLAKLKENVKQTQQNVQTKEAKMTPTVKMTKPGEK